MSTIGIIAEFNPFHNGHAYFIEEAKRLTGADQVVIVMSGNYVQRGTPAFMNKFLRTKAALQNGANLVFELPLVYALSSASYFAEGAVRMLDSMKHIDYLCFGGETNDIQLLEQIADIILNPDEIYTETLQNHLKTGVSFSKSRECAIIKCLSLQGVSIDAKTLSTFISSPNTILGIEYLVALKKIHSSIKPIVIQRNDNGYHSTTIDQKYSSATAIRKLFSYPSTYTFANVKETLGTMIPKNTIPIFEENFKQNYPIGVEDFATLLGFKLNQLSVQELNLLFDANSDLCNRIHNLSDSFTNVTNFVSNCNSKTITTSRILRFLFYALFHYTKEDFETFREEQYIYYYRLLGFRKESSILLSEIKKSSDVPIISKLSIDQELLSDSGKRMLDLNLFADQIYRMVAMNKYSTVLPNEYRQGLILL